MAEAPKYLLPGKLYRVIERITPSAFAVMQVWDNPDPKTLAGPVFMLLNYWQDPINLSRSLAVLGTEARKISYTGSCFSTVYPDGITVSFLIGTDEISMWFASPSLFFHHFELVNTNPRA